MPTQPNRNHSAANVLTFHGSSHPSDVRAANDCMAYVDVDGSDVDEARPMHPRGLPPAGDLTRLLFVSRFPLASGAGRSA
jgi:hypothetical protein